MLLEAMHPVGQWTEAFWAKAVADSAADANPAKPPKQQQRSLYTSAMLGRGYSGPRLSKLPKAMSLGVREC